MGGIISQNDDRRKGLINIQSYRRIGPHEKRAAFLWVISGGIFSLQLKPQGTALQRYDEKNGRECARPLH